MKLTKSELAEMQKLVDIMSKKQNEIGLNTINGHKLTHEFSQLEIELNNQKSALQEKYGKCNINVQTGEIEKIKSNETDKKD